MLNTTQFELIVKLSSSLSVLGRILNSVSIVPFILLKKIFHFIDAQKFPGGLVVRIQCFPCQGRGSVPGN